MNELKKNYVYYLIVNKKDIDMMANDLFDGTYQLKYETKQAYFVLEKMLGYFGIQMPHIFISKNGKPYFEDSNIYFNYSHSKNYIACAISFYELGIDIEECSRTISDSVAKRYLNGEKNMNKRIELWVKKEAYSKLRGFGLFMNFGDIYLDAILNKSIFIKDDKYMCSLYSECENVSFKKIYYDEIFFDNNSK